MQECKKSKYRVDLNPDKTQYLQRDPCLILESILDIVDLGVLQWLK